MKKITLMLIIGISIIIICCDLNKNNSEYIVSTYGNNESHRAGENCMECHKSGGETGIVFSIAGTVYKTNLDIVYPNVTVSISSVDNIDEIPTEVIQVDGRGNFYSNIPIDWQNGLFVSVSSINQIRYMNGSVYNGSCNQCHGLNITRINIE